MPTQLAFALTVIFIFALYVWERKRNGALSRALWLPVLWIIPTASRFPMQWLEIGNPDATRNVTDGSTFDALYFTILIALGGITLLRRKIITAELIRDNKWLVMFLVFGFLSILWSDFQFVAFKRWVKTLGHPIMALIILTDVNPVAAFRTVMKRCGFFLIPASVLFVKYIPEVGRYFSPYGGGMYRGAMLTKNELGIVCVLFGLFFLWTLLSRAQITDEKKRKEEVLVAGTLLLLTLYLLRIASSAMALVVFTMGALILIGFGMRVVSRKYFGTYFFIVVALIGTLELTFGLYEHLLGMLGRDVTLTDRTEIWADVIEIQTRPLIGMGFESFWLGSRLEHMWNIWWWRPNQAHNGYIETYLNLGYIGLGLLIMIAVSAFRKIKSELETDFEFARYRMAVLAAVVAYNITEAMFKGVAITWLMFHIVVITFPRQKTDESPVTESKSNDKTVRTYERGLASARMKSQPEQAAEKHGHTAYYRR